MRPLIVSVTICRKYDEHIFPFPNEKRLGGVDSVLHRTLPLGILILRVLLGPRRKCVGSFLGRYVSVRNINDSGMEIPMTWP